MTRRQAKLIPASATLLLGACALLAGDEQLSNRTPVLAHPIQEFSATGTFDQILVKLAVQIRPSGVIGFVPDHLAAGAPLSITADRNDTLGTVLSRLAASSGRYRFEQAKDPRVLNVVPMHPPEEVSKLLDLKLPSFDMSADLWPMEWYMRIPDYSIEVRAFLEAYYQRQPHPPPADAFPGVNMETDGRPPHLELHLKNVTVRDVLNSVASKYQDWAEMENAPKPENHTGVSYSTFALGWELRWLETQQTQMYSWVHSVFTVFPQSRRE